MWIILVWIVSTLCYLPMHLEKIGYSVPVALVQTKYIFILVPILFGLLFVSRKTSIKKWLQHLFAMKIKMEALVVCGVVALSGIVCTSILDAEAWSGTSLFGIVYLFLMAILEEIAWRGFYLESVMQKRTEGIAVLIVSLEWAIWHIPMWLIRNSLGVKEVAFWLVYTVLVGNILGKCMRRYQNILVPIILHTIFNVCFLMNITISIMVVLLIGVGYLILEKGRSGDFETVGGIYEQK